MGESLEELKERVKYLEHFVECYEKIMRLSEEEIANADKIISMYEQISEYTRKRMIEVREAEAARETVSDLSREELMRAFEQIKELKASNLKLRQVRENWQP